MHPFTTFRRLTHIATLLTACGNCRGYAPSAKELRPVEYVFSERKEKRKKENEKFAILVPFFFPTFQRGVSEKSLFTRHAFRWKIATCEPSRSPFFFKMKDTFMDDSSSGIRTIVQATVMLGKLGDYFVRRFKNLQFRVNIKLSNCPPRQQKLPL